MKQQILIFQQNGSPIKPSITPTLSISEDYKVVATGDGLTESYNPSYEPDTEVEGYYDYVALDKDGETYYIPLTNTNNDDSQFLYNNKYFSNGRYSEETKDGGYYALVSNAYVRNITNGWKFGFQMDNRGNRMPAELLDDALHRVNSAFNTANITVVPTVQSNYIILGEFDDSFVGLCHNETNKVILQLNKPNMISAYGEYNSDKTSAEYKRWLSTAVHELGHTFGFEDQATHNPSLYSYSRNREKALYCQANDLKWLRFAYKERGQNDSIFDGEPRDLSVDLQNAVNENAIVQYNFDYPSFDTIEDVDNYADVTITGTLLYKETKDIEIGKEDYSCILNYNVYEIINEDTIIELKIPSALNIEIENGAIYKLYLKKYDNVPYSLVNMNSFEKIK